MDSYELADILTCLPQEIKLSDLQDLVNGFSQMPQRLRSQLTYKE